MSARTVLKSAMVLATVVLLLFNIAQAALIGAGMSAGSRISEQQSRLVAAMQEDLQSRIRQRTLSRQEIPAGGAQHQTGRSHDSGFFGKDGPPGDAITSAMDFGQWGYKREVYLGLDGSIDQDATALAERINREVAKENLAKVTVGAVAVGGTLIGSGFFCVSVALWLGFILICLMVLAQTRKTKIVVA